MFKSYTYRDEDQLPNDAGIYAFYLDLASLPDLGMYRGRSLDDAQLAAVNDALVRRLRKCFDLFSSREYSGFLVQEDRAAHICGSVKIKGSDEMPQELLLRIGRLAPTDTSALAYFLSKFALFCPPVYVGMTADQTLKQRYRQHRQDFYSAEEGTSFGARLKASGFDWEDLIFTCVEANPSASVSSSSLRAAEQILQAVAKPILSMR